MISFNIIILLIILLLLLFFLIFFLKKIKIIKYESILWFDIEGFYTSIERTFSLKRIVITILCNFLALLIKYFLLVYYTIYIPYPDGFFGWFFNVIIIFIVLFINNFFSHINYKYLFKHLCINKKKYNKSSPPNVLVAASSLAVLEDLMAKRREIFTGIDEMRIENEIDKIKDCSKEFFNQTTNTSNELQQLFMNFYDKYKSTLNNSTHQAILSQLDKLSSIHIEEGINVKKFWELLLNKNKNIEGNLNNIITIIGNDHNLKKLIRKNTDIKSEFKNESKILKEIYKSKLSENNTLISEQISSSDKVNNIITRLKESNPEKYKDYKYTLNLENRSGGTFPILDNIKSNSTNISE